MSDLSGVLGEVEGRLVNLGHFMVWMRRKFALKKSMDFLLSTMAQKDNWQKYIHEVKV